MNKGGLSGAAAIAAALAIGLVFASPAAEARKKVVTKSYTAGVGSPAGGVPIRIPDGAGGARQLVRSSVKVKGLNPRGKIKDVDVGLRISHPFAADLEIYLAAPRGIISLAHDVGGSGSDFGDGFAGCAGGLTVFDSQTPTTIQDPRLSAPFVGVFHPNESLNLLNGLGAKKAENSLWSLLVLDDSPQHGAGTLDCFRLTIRATNPRRK
jgi:subtilisin-like proprotein convertase family protein